MANESMQIFDVWKLCKKGVKRYFFSHNRHTLGHDPVKDPCIEFDTINNILYINYQIVLKEDWTDREESFYYRRVKREFKALGFPYEKMILNLDNLWTSGYTRYKFALTTRKDTIPTREEIERYEKIFRDIEDESNANEYEAVVKHPRAS